MTETQTPSCADCGDTGYIPPFMDECACGRAAWEHTSAAPVIEDAADHGLVAIGEFATDLDGTVRVWNGVNWVVVETEALTPAEYADKYPERLHTLADIAAEDEATLPHTLVEQAAEEAAMAAMHADMDDAIEVITETWPSYDEIVAAVPAMPKPAATKPGRPMTPAQETLLRRLLAERDPANSVVAAATKALDEGAVFLSSKHASRLIDGLMTIPASPALKPPRPNKYDGTCKLCHGHVAAGTGRIEQVDEKWTTFHLAGGCVTGEAKVAADADRVDEPGLYKYTGKDGVPHIFRVKQARSSKRLYAERIVIDHDHDHGHVDFIYNANAISFLSKSAKLTWQEARDFGAMYGACVACGRTLSDPRSIVQMYGATCAGHFGWPTVTLKQAEGIIAGVMTWDEVTGMSPTTV